MENTQVQTVVPANPEGAQVPPSTNGALPAELQNYAAEPTTNAPANPEGAQVQVQPTPTVAPEVAELQRKLNERQIEIYQAQQRAQAAEQLLHQQIPQKTSDPEPDPNQNWAAWIQWNQRQTETRIMEGVAKQQQQWLNGLMASANENKFIETHPGVDLGQLKSFAQMRGIQNIEDAYVIMNLPQLTNGAAISASQQTIQQFRQPSGATPLRTQQTSAPQGVQQVSYQKMAEAYSANPSVEATWPKELKEMFWQETFRRKNSA
jgi:hypothetical protein